MKLDRIALLLLLVVAGCGSNDRANAPGADSSQPTGAATTPAPNTPDNSYTAENREMKAAVPDTTGWTAAGRGPAFAETLPPENAPDAHATASGQDMSATIDGVAWKAQRFNAATVDGSTAITGIGPDGTAIMLNLGTVKRKGKISLRPAESGPYATYISRDAVSFTTLTVAHGGGSGTVEVTELDDSHIVGTYSFTATAQTEAQTKATIARGSFDVRF